MPEAKLQRLVGEFREIRTGKLRRAGWDMDRVFLDGKQVGITSHRPGAVVTLLAGVLLTPSERKAIEDVVTDARNGVKPSKIGGPIQLPYELLDDEEESDTDLDGGDDE